MISFKLMKKVQEPSIIKQKVYLAKIPKVDFSHSLMKLKKWHIDLLIDTMIKGSFIQKFLYFKILIVLCRISLNLFLNLIK